MVDDIRVRPEQYDPRTGQWVRDVKENDIANLNTSMVTTVANSGAVASLASTTMPSTKQGVLTSFGYGLVNGGPAAFAITINNSTILPAAVDSGQTFAQSQTDNGPFAFIPASAVVSIIGLIPVSGTSGTVTAYANWKLEPTVDNLETD